MGCIYKITNLLNNKSYIGKTSFSLDVRWNKHLQSYNNSNSHCYNYYLYRAMRKHGISNFNIELLEEISNDSLLNEREQYWIKFYDTFQNGYNMTLGGEGQQLYDKEKIISLWEDGKSIKEIKEIIDCSSDTIYLTIKDLDSYSPKESQIRSAKSKEVSQYDLNGNYIKTYHSIKEACEKNNISIDILSTYLNKNRIFCHDYLWSFEKKNKITPTRKWKAIPIKCIDKDTKETICKFSSIMSAERWLNKKGANSNIKKCLIGKYKTAYGYIWEEDNEET